MSLTSLLRRLASIGNKCPPLIAKQYLTLFSRNTRPISAPPSSLAISNLLILPSPALGVHCSRSVCCQDGRSLWRHPAMFRSQLQAERGRVRWWFRVRNPGPAVGGVKPELTCFHGSGRVGTIAGQNRASPVNSVPGLITSGRGGA